MASKVRDLRITQTKQSLINAFFSLASKKDFEKITIADITKGAQVNRATFYAHFNDKYDLIDYIMGDFASASIENHTSGIVKFDQHSIIKLILAVCDFYQQPNIECRSSYGGLVLPQMKEKILKELKVYLSKSMEHIYTDSEKNMFVPIFAQIIHEGALQWSSGDLTMNKEEAAKKIALFVLGGSQTFEETDANE
ncbi:TetR/AcrR family transcriptional regulator [Paenibacillus sp. 1011MAR3C5]|uniref:TetR/AcrR family transcriptional regulator n=1 Tax=Paenibacillus sp. 1011MAR3C5 TaxID=1675787 RepID=UPI000E6B7423|nr:TetR/AcrR family transcriptional regulator [Paenibacillus sp. 1011MAR3C5]RJE90408.1 TetR/AcrR family transcriptional regulator [Paenibacillus sp. 1011MAR3C5]